MLRAFLKWTLGLAGVAMLLGSCSLYGPRIGAVCNDGWRSNAVGQGACSHHGGVDRWIHNDPQPGLRWGLAIFGGISLLVSAFAASSTEKNTPSLKQNGVHQLQHSKPQQHSAEPTHQFECMNCGARMVIRTRRRDGIRFLGCTRFPKCRYTKELPQNPPNSSTD
jgi:hypothetical protein